MTTETLIPERLERLRTIELIRGGGDNPDNPDEACEMCTAQASAWLYGRPWSDRDELICPAVGAAMRALNDSITDAAVRTDLLARTPSLEASITVRAIGSRGSHDLTEARGWTAVDFAVRTVLPTWLDLLGKSNPDAKRHAAALRALDPIVGIADLDATQKVRDEALEFCRAAARNAVRAAAWDAAEAAGAAAGHATWDAAWDAVRAATRDAERAATGRATADAAWATSWATSWAAGAAAGHATEDVLAPTVVLLQRETAAWIHRMLDMDEAEVAA